MIRLRKRWAMVHIATGETLRTFWTRGEAEFRADLLNAFATVLSLRGRVKVERR